MSQRVLILGGSGRIGRNVADDLLQQTTASMTLTGRQPSPNFAIHSRQQYCSLHLSHTATDSAPLANPSLNQLIADHDLVIHCAGPFRSRDLTVLKACIEQRKPYIDVADSPDYVREALKYHAQAQTQGVTCVVSTGVFPGISNSMVRQGIEQFDRADTVHLSYLVAGSGGAGVTVLRTTFIELQTPFEAKVKGQWQTISPYSEREVLDFPAPYNQGAGVYWYNTVEAMTLAQSFPQLKTVTTKFGSLPDFYNRLTGAMARLPQTVLRQPSVIEGLAQISYAMTQLSDRWSGIGIAMRLAITGEILTESASKAATYLATCTHPDTAQAAGFGTGAVAESILSGQLTQPGVWPVEKGVPTAQFASAMVERGLNIQQRWL